MSLGASWLRHVDFRKRRKCFSWRVSVESQVLPGRQPSPCVSWEQEVGMLLKMATAPSLPGTAGPRLSRTQQCAGPSALSAGTCHHLPCLARCVVQEALFRAHLQCGVPCCSLTTCSSLEGGRGRGRGWTWCLVEWMEDRKKRCVGMGSRIQLQKGTDV